MYEEIISELAEGISKVQERLERELVKTRTGRANLNILDSVKVEYYGAATPLNQVAALSVQDARMIIVKPWDATLLADIERAIMKASIGITPSNDGEIIRLPVPPLTQERRQDICRQVRQKGEDSKVAVRGCRRDANEMIKNLDGISEDNVKCYLANVQEDTDRAVKEIDTRIASKEVEIMEV
jgi:ribosome recycling factor